MSLPKNLQDCYFYYYSVCRKVRHAFDISISDCHRITDSKKWLFIGNKLSISSRASSFRPWTCLLEMDWEPMFPSKLPRSSHGYWKSTVTHTKFYVLIDLGHFFKNLLVYFMIYEKHSILCFPQYYFSNFWWM